MTQTGWESNSTGIQNHSPNTKRKWGLTVHPATIMLWVPPSPLHFSAPLGLHTVERHQNKQRRSRGNERLQCFGNTRVLATRVISCQLAGVKGDRWVDRREGLKTSKQLLFKSLSTCTGTGTSGGKGLWFNSPFNTGQTFNGSHTSQLTHAWTKELHILSKSRQNVTNVNKVFPLRPEGDEHHFYVPISETIPIWKVV